MFNLDHGNSLLQWIYYTSLKWKIWLNYFILNHILYNLNFVLVLYDIWNLNNYYWNMKNNYSMVIWSKDKEGFSMDSLRNTKRSLQLLNWKKSVENVFAPISLPRLIHIICYIFVQQKYPHAQNTEGIIVITLPMFRFQIYFYLLSLFLLLEGVSSSYSISTWACIFLLSKADCLLLLFVESYSFSAIS